MADQPEAPTNWAQARAQIDRGETGDKLAAPDPAAAPLGTDAEAGGATTEAKDIARSARLQMGSTPSDTATQAPRPSAPTRLVPWLVLVLALAAAIVAALLIAG